MHSQFIDHLNNKSNTLTIYQLAKASDEDGLRDVLRHGAAIGELDGEYNAVMLLAMENDHNAVFFLINKFNASLNHAVFGTARGGHDEFVERLIELGANFKHHAVLGYAQANKVERVNDLLLRGASKIFALNGYAKSNNKAEIKKLLNQGVDEKNAVFSYAVSGNEVKVDELLKIGVDTLMAIKGYAFGMHHNLLKKLVKTEQHQAAAVQACALVGNLKVARDWLSTKFILMEAIKGSASGGHVSDVNSLLQHPLLQGEKVIDELAYAYISGGHLDQIERLLKMGVVPTKIAEALDANNCLKNNETISRILSFISDNIMRCKLTNAIGIVKKDINKNTILSKSQKLSLTMSRYGLGYGEAVEYQAVTWKMGVHIWLLQGIQLVRRDQLSLDSFIHITTFLTKLSYEDTKQFYSKYIDIMSTQLLRDSHQRITQQYESGKSNNFMRLFSSMTKEEYEVRCNKLLDNYRTRKNIKTLLK